jgi:hypothetical protein
MLNAGFAAASLLALLAFAVHTFVGGIYVVRPLLAVEGLTRASRWLNYYCWHMTTLTLLVMTTMFAYAAHEPGARGFGLLFTAMAGAFRRSASASRSRAACDLIDSRRRACSARWQPPVSGVCRCERRACA